MLRSARIEGGDLRGRRDPLGVNLAFEGEHDRWEPVHVTPPASRRTTATTCRKAKRTEDACSIGWWQPTRHAEDGRHVRGCRLRTARAVLEVGSDAWIRGSDASCTAVASRLADPTRPSVHHVPAHTCTASPRMRNVQIRETSASSPHLRATWPVLRT